ncbi:MAG: metallophosphoesterase [Myxococcales bacterium]|nr:metallophosphoesterase [Myxococcales bacterium]MCB9645462.1 metallophosphoesterase [Deltaproteobacteria bacterium]
MSRRRFLQASAAVAATAVTGRAAADCAPRVRIRHHQVPWSGRQALRVVHITDVHVGWSTPGVALAAAVDAARVARPHLVALTGDYVNTSLQHGETLRRFVRALPGPVVATLGNHDHWADGPGMAKLLEREGVMVLRNQWVEARPAGQALRIVGVDDARTNNHDLERAFHRVEDPGSALVLSHDPSVADEIAEHGGRLILSGHTHGGQVQVPGLTDAVGRAVGMPYMGGWYDAAKARLYVNAGLGHSRAGLRVGKGASAEVAVLDLVPQAG